MIWHLKHGTSWWSPLNDKDLTVWLEDESSINRILTQVSICWASDEIIGSVVSSLKAKANIHMEKLKKKKKTSAFAASNKLFLLLGSIILAHLPCNCVDRNSYLYLSRKCWFLDIHTPTITTHIDTNPQILKSESMWYLHRACIL